MGRAGESLPLLLCNQTQCLCLSSGIEKVRCPLLSYSLSPLRCISLSPWRHLVASPDDLMHLTFADPNFLRVTAATSLVPRLTRIERVPNVFKELDAHGDSVRNLRSHKQFQSFMNWTTPPSSTRVAATFGGDVAARCLLTPDYQPSKLVQQVLPRQAPHREKQPKKRPRTAKRVRVAPPSPPGATVQGEGDPAHADAGAPVGSDSEDDSASEYDTWDGLMTIPEHVTGEPASWPAVLKSVDTKCTDILVRPLLNAISALTGQSFKVAKTNTAETAYQQPVRGIK